MAEATRDIKVTKIVKTDVITLELTLVEAEALRAITMMISGHPNDTRRGLIDNINAALRDTGVSYDTSDIQNGMGFTKRG